MSKFNDLCIAQNSLLTYTAEIGDKVLKGMSEYIVVSDRAITSML